MNRDLYLCAVAALAVVGIVVAALANAPAGAYGTLGTCVGLALGRISASGKPPE